MIENSMIHEVGNEDWSRDVEGDKSFPITDAYCTADRLPTYRVQFLMSERSIPKICPILVARYILIAADAWISSSRQDCGIQQLR